jgi:exodeoxyribonuclease V alpha subunit
MVKSHHHFAAFFKREEEQPIQPYAYAVSKQLAQGSICLETTYCPIDIYEGFPDVETAKKDFSVEHLREITGLVGSVNNLDKPFILHRDNLYITRYH